MTADDRAAWSRISAAFHEAAGMEGKDRAAFLDALQRDEPEAYDEVVSLLHADESADRLTGRPLPQPTDRGAHDPATQARIGTRVGAWTLDGFLAQGGMGAVFTAHRSSGDFDQRAAIKLLHAGMGGQDALQRFESERKILARLEHPNIARLLDGGTTHDGLPWFAMELVRGTTLAEYARQEQLDLEARLWLLIEVCDAVDAAHRNLVVHRDLKPSNILVNEDGRPKLLDFGIARLLEPDDGDRSLTRGGPQPLTPAYTSPEQLDGAAITTATDAYALGLLLFELVTGQHPYRAASNDVELREAIRTQPPPDPSIVAAQAGGPSEPKDWARRLRGDIDLICRKALRKEPERRYPTAVALADDLRRFLGGNPVSARPDSATYRLNRWLRRNRAVAAVSAAAILGLVGTITVYTARLTTERDRATEEAARAADEAERAAAVSDFLFSIFRSNIPSVGPGRELTARDILNWGNERIAEELVDQPGARGQVMVSIAEAYAELGYPDSALSMIDQALPIVEAADGRISRRYGLALGVKETTLNQVGRLEERLAVSLEQIEIYTALDGPDAEHLALAYNRKALSHTYLGDLEASVAASEEALRIAELHYEPTDSRVLTMRSNLGNQLSSVGRHDEALAMIEAVAAARRELGLGDRVAPDLVVLGVAYRRAGRPAEGVRPILEALEIYERTLNDGHIRITNARMNLASAYLSMGRLDDAVTMYEGAIEDATAPMDVALSKTGIGQAMLYDGRPASAIVVLEEAIELIRSAHGDHLNLAFPLTALGTALARTGDLAKSEEALREAIAIRTSQLGAEHSLTAHSELELGLTLLRTGAADEAAELIERAYDVVAGAVGEASPEHVAALIALGALREAESDHAAARELWGRAASVAEGARGPEAPGARRARRLLKGG